MSNANVSVFDGVGLKLGNQSVEFSSLFSSLQTQSGVNYRYASRVIAAIFQTAKPAKQNIKG
jgi:hypothetical protein